MSRARHRGRSQTAPTVCRPIVFCSDHADWERLGYTFASKEIRHVSRRRSFEVPGLQHENPIPMGCVIGPFMMSSGIFGMDPETRKIPPDIDSQCKLMLANVRRVMEAAGGSVNDIIKMVVWTKDKTFKEALNKEWLVMFSHPPSPRPRPTRLYDGVFRNTLHSNAIPSALGARNT